MCDRVFHINAEIRPVNDATLDPEEIAGAVVRCLVPSPSADAALMALAERLAADGLELVEAEWCVDFDETEWDHPDDSFESTLAMNARRTGTIQFGTFHVWGHDDSEAETS